MVLSITSRRRLRHRRRTAIMAADREELPACRRKTLIGHSVA